VHVYLILLADATTIDVILDESGKSWLPIVAREKFLGFKVSRMFCGRGIVMEGSEFVVKITRWYISESFVRKNTITQFPIGKS